MPGNVREMAGFSIALLDLVSAVVEEGILPVISPANASFALVAAAPVAGNPDNSRPWMEPGATQLKAALALARKNCHGL